MIASLVKKLFLKTFYEIDLSGVELEIANESVAEKYAKGVGASMIVGLLVVPAILFLNTTVLISVLIPITMVTGTAWFAISLASMKKKFETFGLELTTDMFTSFVSSLAILGWLAALSFFTDFLSPVNAWGQENPWVQIVSAILGTIAVLHILKNALSGSLKYDMNDAMLTGQNEAAEKFFKKSLSLLHASSDSLRSGKGLVVANYYIGTSFYEVFSFIDSTGVLNGKIKALKEDALQLKRQPAMEQEKADKISIRLIESFVGYCTNIEGDKSEKSFEHVNEELKALKENDEPQEMVDTRLSIIFEEIAELMDLQGEGLFKKSGV